MTLIFILFPALRNAGENSLLIAAEKSDAFRLADASNVALSGYLGEKINLCIHRRVQPQDVDHLIEPFRHHNETRLWQTEFWGKWFTSAALAYRYTQVPKLRAILDRAVQGLIATQSPDGYIGNYRDDAHLQAWDVWGRKYVLLGLLDYYDITGDGNTLAAARKLVDQLLTETGPGKADIVKLGNFRGMPACSILEPVVLLYNRTGEQRYLDFARYIVQQWETPQGPQLISKALAGVDVADRFPPPPGWWTWDNGQKAYEMMSCYEGLCELYRVDGDPMYLEAARKSMDNILAKEINIVGGGSSMECWFHGRERQTTPARHTMETCVTVTFLKFCVQMLRLTGDVRYADAVETTLYNALLGAMTSDGSNFAKYSSLAGPRLPGENQCGMNLHCCNANGPRGLLKIPEIVVMASDAGPVVNLFTPGTAAVALPSGNRVAIEQQTGYPVSGTVQLTVKPQQEARFTLQIRIPAWSAETALTVNGEPQSGVAPGTYARIDRTWRSGDTVKLTLDMRGRIVAAPGGGQYRAVLRGPIVLARDDRFADGDIDEPLESLQEKGGYVELQPVVPAPEAAQMAFTAPVTLDLAGGQQPPKVNLVLCDYASAGNTWNRENRYRVWLPVLLDIMKQ